MVARTSATPDMTADTVWNSAPIASARSRASEVLPVPGGPHRSIEARWPRRDGAAQGPAVADEVRLAHELLERARAHPGGEGLPLGRWLEQGLGLGTSGARSGGRHDGESIGPAFGEPFRAGIGDALYDAAPVATWDQFLFELQRVVRVIDVDAPTAS